MRTSIFCIISFLFLSACNKPIGGIVIDVSVDIHYATASNANLFPNPSNGFVQDSVRLFVMQNGVKKMVYLSSPGVTLSYPYQYLFYDNGGKNCMRIFTNNNVVNDTATTYIRLSNTLEDTIKCSFLFPNRGSGSIVVDKVWYNGRLMNGFSFTVVHWLILFLIHPDPLNSLSDKKFEDIAFDNNLPE